MSANRRDFIKKVTAGAAGIAVGGSAMGMSAKSYSRVIGANERLNVAIVGLGRRLGAYYQPVAMKEANVELVYLCDVMKKQREKALQSFSKFIDYKPKLENDIRKVIDDPKVDVVFNATPDHWHTPGSIMAMKGGKHVYVEKPCSHNMFENELLVKAAKKLNKVVQMGNQQRSSDHTIEIINEIHNGVIGTPYKALAFYTNKRGEVPLQKKAPAPEGLDWELFQGPAPRRDYTVETWDYNWHWYGWDYGTAESGNNATHELDVARWALGVDLPLRVDVEAAKRHFLNDGWEMYDTMEATFRFSGNKIIQWDGKSRNGYDTYNSDRGTIIYGSEGSVFVNRNKYMLFDRAGKMIKDNKSASNEAGTALGGGGDMTTTHVLNFFETIRGKQKLTAPIDDASISMAMVHYSNIAYRVGRGFDIDEKTGRMFDRDAMKLWSREYAPGWEPTL
ncbi:Tat (twin-arginine translocation) pathway signal sequence [Mariniphaga anaerophila]|uniref:Tat (Twin-arginine translocation) pathway signal sequence n=1 Tax=Mariniphaga anaerophila TaxID=1484053 RepID=A0A1M4Y577_9BACT|nr:Gfo/Idh/MocA family oxidoreductase [Mariniphaga anaerophila]SHF00858.1 Tat (twin-arginine translocation) pathway signal sequence [Mariniphaga anaerophila]